MHFWHIAIYFILSPSVVQAQAQEVWDISKILSRAQENAPLLQASEKQVESAGAWAEQAGRWDNPEINGAFGSYKELGILGKANTIGFMQPIPVFGQKNIARKIGDQEKKIAESDRDIQRLVLQHDVVVSTFRLAAILEQEKHIAHRRERLEMITRYLRTRPFASPAQVIEKNLIENRMREIEEKFVQLLSKKEEVWQHLNLYLGLTAPIVPKVEWYKKPQGIQVPEVNMVYASSPELVRQSQSVSLSELQMEREGKKVYPDVRVGASYYNQEVGTNLQTSYVGMVELTVPLWNRGGGARNAARAQNEVEKFKYEHKRRELNSNLQKSIVHIKETQRKIELYPPSLMDQLEKQMHTAEANWKKGLVNAPAFLELENQVHEQTDRIYDVQVEYVQSLGELQILTGQKIIVGEK